MRARRIRHPERFSPPAKAAQLLRKLAYQLEHGEHWIALAVDIQFATEAEIATASARAKRPSRVVSVGHGVPAPEASR